MITAAVYLGALRAHWGKLLGLAAAGLLIGIVASFFVPTSYTANRLLVVTTQGGKGLTDLSQGGSVAETRAQSLAYVGNSQPTLFEALSKLGVAGAGAGDYRVAAAVPANTTYVEINTRAPSESGAIDLGRVAAESLVAANAQLTSPLSGSRQEPVVVKDITPSSAATSAWRAGLPRWLLPLAGAVLLPLLAYFLFVLRSAVKPSVGESLDLDEIVPFPVVGSIPRERNRDPEVVRPLPAHFTALGRSGLTETARNGHIVALTAVEGPSDCRPALGLAQALGQLGRRVIVVDGDLRQPSLDGASVGGLAGVLSNGTDISIDQRNWLDSPVRVLPTAANTAATRLLLAPAAAAAFHELRESYDAVLVSTASALSGPDATALSEIADEVILMADTSTPIDRIVDAGLGYREGSITGLLVLDRGRRRPSLHAVRSSATAEGGR